MKSIQTFFLSVIALCCALSVVSADDRIQTGKTEYRTNEPIVITFSGASGSPLDWISIVPVNAPPSEGGEYKHISWGEREGKMVFDPMPPGKYEARAYYNYQPGRYRITARTQFTVLTFYDNSDARRLEWNRLKDLHPGEILYTTKDVYDENERIEVMFFKSTGDNEDFMTIVPAGTTDKYLEEYHYMPAGMREGSLFFSSHPPGDYEVRVYYQYKIKGNVVAARYPFSVR